LTLLITDEEKPIHFLSKCFIGGGATPRKKSHDYAILKSLFKPVESSWFNNHHIKVDLGFLGIAKDYLCKKLSIPKGVAPPS